MSRNSVDKPIFIGMVSGVEKRLNMAMLLDLYGGALSEMQREVMRLFYDEDMTQTEIAQETGISRQAVNQALQRAEAKLEEYEALLGIMKRDMALRQRVRAAIDCIERGDTAQAAEDLKLLIEREDLPHGV